MDSPRHCRYRVDGRSETMDRERPVGHSAAQLGGVCEELRGIKLWRVASIRRREKARIYEFFAEKQFRSFPEKPRCTLREISAVVIIRAFQKLRSGAFRSVANPATISVKRTVLEACGGRVLGWPGSSGGRAQP